MRLHLVRKSAAIVALCLCACFPAFAQTSYTTVNGTIRKADGTLPSGTLQFKLSQAATAGNPPLITSTSTGSGSLTAGTYCLELQGVGNFGSGTAYSSLSNEECVTVSASSKIVVNFTSPAYDEVFIFFGSIAGGENNYFYLFPSPVSPNTYTYTLSSTGSDFSGSPFTTPLLGTIFLGPQAPTTCTVTSGAVSGCSVLGNTLLEPFGTYYEITGYDTNNRVIFGPAPYQIPAAVSGATSVDLSTLPIAIAGAPFSEGTPGPTGPTGAQGPSGSGHVASQIFISSGTFTIPTGVTALKVTAIAGGGGGGGSSSSVAGGGGGAGAATVKWLSGVTPGLTISVGVGAGGSGGAANSNGSAGGTSTVSSGTQTITSFGANGGGGGFDGSSVGAGGPGGSAGSFGDLNFGGSGGGNGTTVGAPGGPSFFGGGGASATGGPGNAAVAAGAGGGGAGISSFAGGAGANGVVVFEWVNP